MSMSNKEAITWLSQLSAGIEWELDMHYAEAIDMAIEALRAQDVPDMNDGDTIYRRDALDILDEFEESVENGTPYYAKARGQMCNLPSAQSEIVRCRDCKHFIKDYGWNSIEYTVCSISPIHKVIRQPDDFCSRARRKE